MIKAKLHPRCSLIVLAGAFMMFVTALCSAAYAVPDTTIDKETRELCNKIMLNIYYDILDISNKYLELHDFGEGALFKNKQDIYTIIYRYKGDANQLRDNVYEFGITIIPIDEDVFEKEGRFTYEFPVLGIKFSGFIKKSLFKDYYDISKSINKFAYLLADHQQGYLPLSLSITPTKQEYGTEEPIEFEVTLTNNSDRRYRVKDLGADTLYFIFNNKEWGTEEVQPKKSSKRQREVILQAHKNISMKFKGEYFRLPKEFEIYCLYKMAINGVQPYAKLKVKVINK